MYYIYTYIIYIFVSTIYDRHGPEKTLPFRIYTLEHRRVYGYFACGVPVRVSLLCNNDCDSANVLVSSLPNLSSPLSLSLCCPPKQPDNAAPEHRSV